MRGEAYLSLLWKILGLAACTLLFIEQSNQAILEYSFEQLGSFVCDRRIASGCHSFDGSLCYFFGRNSTNTHPCVLFSLAAVGLSLVSHIVLSEGEIVLVYPSTTNISRFRIIPPADKSLFHNHYLEEAKKKTQERGRTSRPSMTPSAKSQSTTNGNKPKPRSNTQTSRNWPVSKNSFITTKTVPIAELSRNSRNFSDSKHFVCSACQKCVFNANHDSCVTKFLNEVNSRAKVPSNKTTNKNKPVEQTSFAKKPERQIPKGHLFSIKKTFVVHEKTMTPRSCLRWKPTGKIFKTVGLRWVPTGKIFTSSTTKVDSKPPNGSNDDITNPYECK
ncbi:hypothetical protein Tco_0079790 [Tanacetum coccineum]